MNSDRSNSNSSEERGKLNKITKRDRRATSNQVKFSDVFMSGAALVSKEPGGSNAVHRFVVLTSNQLCCYEEYGIGPSPTDAIEVEKIVNIHCSQVKLTITVTAEY
jgi:hypothetical protein